MFITSFLSFIDNSFGVPSGHSKTYNLWVFVLLLFLAHSVDLIVNFTVQMYFSLITLDRTLISLLKSDTFLQLT